MPAGSASRQPCPGGTKRASASIPGSAAQAVARGHGGRLQAAMRPVPGHAPARSARRRQRRVRAHAPNRHSALGARRFCGALRMWKRMPITTACRKWRTCGTGVRRGKKLPPAGLPCAGARLRCGTLVPRRTPGAGRATAALRAAARPHMRPRAKACPTFHGLLRRLAMAQQATSPESPSRAFARGHGLAKGGSLAFHPAATALRSAPRRHAPRNTTRARATVTPPRPAPFPRRHLPGATEQRNGA